MPTSSPTAFSGQYGCLFRPGQSRDTVLALELSHGGHLTHGHPLSFSGQLYNVIHYNVRQDTKQFDYDEIERLASNTNPK
ncbi:MAG: hypothetical protein LRZ88_08895 [Candidatus Cloacimonetes bacterium]|nr:hypothetical protein [Candidatus Cloacimonadota bacterium]